MNDYLNAYCKTLMQWPRDGFGVLVSVALGDRLGYTGAAAQAVEDAANFAVVTVTAPNGAAVYELSPIAGLTHRTPHRVRKAYKSFPSIILGARSLCDIRQMINVGVKYPFDLLAPPA